MELKEIGKGRAVSASGDNNTRWSFKYAIRNSSIRFKKLSNRNSRKKIIVNF